MFKFKMCTFTEEVECVIGKWTCETKKREIEYSCYIKSLQGKW